MLLWRAKLSGIKTVCVCHSAIVSTSSIHPNVSLGGLYLLALFFPITFTQASFLAIYQQLSPTQSWRIIKFLTKSFSFFVIILEFSCKNHWVFLQKYSRFVIKTFRFHMFWVCYWICWVFHVRWSQLRIVYLSVRDQSWRILKFSAFSHLSFLKNCLSFFDSLSLFSLSFFKKWPKNKPNVA